jgi:hypothetical protein
VKLHIQIPPEASHLNAWAQAMFRYFQSRNPADLPSGTAIIPEAQGRHAAHILAQHGVSDDQK